RTRRRAMRRTTHLRLGLAVMAVLVLLMTQGTPLLPSAAVLRPDLHRTETSSIGAREDALPSAVEREAITTGEEEDATLHVQVCGVPPCADPWLWVTVLALPTTTAADRTPATGESQPDE